MNRKVHKVALVLDFMQMHLLLAYLIHEIHSDPLYVYVILILLPVTMIAALKLNNYVSESWFLENISNTKRE